MKDINRYTNYLVALLFCAMPTWAHAVGDRADSHALSQLHHFNAHAVSMGATILSRQASAGLHAYAVQFTREHQASDDRVIGLAQARHLSLIELTPADSEDAPLLEADRKEAEALRGLEGADWEQAFLEHAIGTHERQDRLLRTELSELSADVRGMVEEYLVVGQAHIVGARALLSPSKQ